LTQGGGKRATDRKDTFGLTTPTMFRSLERQAGCAGYQRRLPPTIIWGGRGRKDQEGIGSGVVSSYRLSKG